MNKDNAKDFLPLVKALAEGRVIQFKSDDAGWVDAAPDIGWTMRPSAYRIKPEPREWFLWRNCVGELCPIEIRNDAPQPPMEQCIKVREVLE